MISRVGARVINHHSINRPCGCCGLQSLAVLYWCERLSPRAHVPPPLPSPLQLVMVLMKNCNYFVSSWPVPRRPGRLSLVTNEPKYKCRPSTQAAALQRCRGRLCFSANVISLSLSVFLHCNRTVTVSVTLHLLNNERSEESRSSLLAYFEYFTQYRGIRVEVGIKLLLEGFA